MAVTSDNRSKKLCSYDCQLKHIASGVKQTRKREVSDKTPQRR